jgi:hypothetical protein
VTPNIASGWNLGGPWVQLEEASKLLTRSRATIKPGDAGPVDLALLPVKNGFYRQVSVLAYPPHRGPALAGKIR